VLLSKISIKVDAVKKLCSTITKEYYYCKNPNYIVKKYAVRLNVGQLIVK